MQHKRIESEKQISIKMIIHPVSRASFKFINKEEENEAQCTNGVKSLKLSQSPLLGKSFQFTLIQTIIRHIACIELSFLSGT